MRIQNYHSASLDIENFYLGDGEAWCVLGSNRSGIASFIKLFSKPLLPHEGIDLSEEPAVLSFSQLQEIFEEELKNNNTDFLDRIDPGTPARNFIVNPEQHKHLLEAFNLEDCLDKGFKQLSTGESRKLLLVSTLSKNPGVILIENPYDGLDIASCKELDQALQSLSRFGRKIIVTVNNIVDVPTWCSHLAVLQDGRFVLQGRKDEVLSHAADISTNNVSPFEVDMPCTAQKLAKEELISLSDGFASYGDRQIFSQLNFSVNDGQHTLFTGPNGSGKSTLLQIIIGDNQKCYANNLRIFGKQRGTGESIWEIKKQMGIVSPDLHRNHYIPGSAVQVVLSGFFDSIGVYRSFSESQRQDAHKWLKMTGLQDKFRCSFRELSFAEQRLCLIARALIKMPRLLILDEPTQGLDQGNRNNLLNFLEKIAKENMSTIIYASHRTDEYRSFFQQQIDLADYN